MEESVKKSNNKIIIVLIIVAVLAILGGIIFFFVKKGNQSYRVIKVFEVEGNTVVTREKKGEMDAYENMLLESGDQVNVKDGKTTLRLDEDKYVYAEADTKFTLLATGNSDDSKTTITVDEGSITSDIQNKLSKSSSYEVNTENSNMSVRGTMFRVSTYTDENGVKYTKVSVFTGQVATRLVHKDGTVSDEEVLVDNNKEIVIFEDDTTVDYYSDVRDIDYTELPADVISLLIEKMNDGELTLDITPDDLEKIKKEIEAQGPFTVTFKYQGKVFGTQTVKYNDYASEPSLMPAQGGSWDYDFTKAIKKDTVIEWK